MRGPASEQLIATRTVDRITLALEACGSSGVVELAVASERLPVSSVRRSILSGPARTYSTGVRDLPSFVSQTITTIGVHRCLVPG
jgi:hypothetical protein